MQRSGDDPERLRWAQHRKHSPWLPPLCNAFIVNILSQLTMAHKKDSRVKVMHVALRKESKRLQENRQEKC